MKMSVAVISGNYDISSRHSGAVPGVKISATTKEEIFTLGGVFSELARVLPRDSIEVTFSESDASISFWLFK